MDGFAFDMFMSWITITCQNVFAYIQTLINLIACIILLLLLAIDRHIFEFSMSDQNMATTAIGLTECLFKNVDVLFPPDYFDSFLNICGLLKFIVFSSVLHFFKCVLSCLWNDFL